MSKPRYRWWGNARNIARDYLKLKAMYEDLRQQDISASISSMPGGGDISRTAENLALRQLPKGDQQDYEAGYSAEQYIRRDTDGAIWLKTVELVFWKSTHTIAGAAQQMHISERTARRYCWLYIMRIGVAMGKLTEEEYAAAEKRDKGQKLDSQSQKTVV